MSDFKKTNGIYMGRLLTSEGTIGKGKRIGYPFKRWKFEFKPNEEAEKTFSMSCFQDVVKQADGTFKFTPLKDMKRLIEMEEGEWYHLTYTETKGEYNGEEITYINLFKIEKGKKDVPEYKESTKQNNQQSTKIVVKEWVVFAEGYNKLMEGKPDKSPIHMLGAYMANKEADNCTDIITLCKNNFK